MPELVITVPVWDREQQHRHTARALVDLCHNTIHPSMTAVFVDNASPFPGTRQLLQDTLLSYPGRLHVILNDTNRGYAGGCNQGLHWGYENGAEYFIVCNNDIQFLSPVWYEGMVNALKRNPKSLVGGRYIPNNEWVHFGGKYHPYLEGYMVAFTRGFLDEVGYFDEIFHPAWVEDVDLSWRAVQHGYELVEVQEIPIRHVYGQTGYDGRLAFNALCARNVGWFRGKVEREESQWIGPPLFRSREE